MFPSCLFGLGHWSPALGWGLHHHLSWFSGLWVQTKLHHGLSWVSSFPIASGRTHNLHNHVNQIFTINPCVCLCVCVSMCACTHMCIKPGQPGPRIYILSLLILLFFLGCACGMWTFPGQGSNFYHSSDLSHCVTTLDP